MKTIHFIAEKVLFFLDGRINADWEVLVKSKLLFIDFQQRPLEYDNKPKPVTKSILFVNLCLYNKTVCAVVISQSEKCTVEALFFLHYTYGILHLLDVYAEKGLGTSFVKGFLLPVVPKKMGTGGYKHLCGAR